MGDGGLIGAELDTPTALVDGQIQGEVCNGFSRDHPAKVPHVQSSTLP